MGFFYIIPEQKKKKKKNVHFDKTKKLRISSF